MKTTDFDGAFAALRKILKRCAPNCAVKADTATNYYLETRTPDLKGKPLFVGAVQMKKNYVSYHLMAVYIFPELLKCLSPELKKRMQGKACFSFTAPDAALFAELEKLTSAGIEKCKSAKNLWKKDS